VKFTYIPHSSYSRLRQDDRFPASGAASTLQKRAAKQVGRHHCPQSCAYEVGRLSGPFMQVFFCFDPIETRYQSKTPKVLIYSATLGLGNHTILNQVFPLNAFLISLLE
jgi:hypothetical protein